MVVHDSRCAHSSHEHRARHPGRAASARWAPHLCVKVGGGGLPAHATGFHAHAFGTQAAKLFGMVKAMVTGSDPDVGESGVVNVD